MPRLASKVAIVTGGAQGIGRAIVEKLSQEGALVTFLDVDSVAGSRTAAELSSSFLPADVTSESDVRSAFHHVIEAHGRLDILVNNAGRNSFFDATLMTSEQWDSVIALNLKAAWLCSKYALPVMQRIGGGSIVNIASLHARMTTTGMFPYAAAKAGLLGLTRSLALDYGPSQIRVNAILPGWTRTPAVEDWFRHQPNPAAAEQRVLDTQPLRRIASPAEVANLVAFVASDEASAITGSELTVDCGLGARYAG